MAILGCEQASGQKQPGGHGVSGPRCLRRGGGARLWPSTTHFHAVEGSGGIQKLLLLLRVMGKRRGPRQPQSCKWMGRRAGDVTCHSSVPGPHPGCRIHGSRAPREGSGSSARGHEPQAAGCLMERQRLHLGPRLPWGSPGRPTEHLPTACCFSPSVAGPEDADPAPGARLRGPQLLPLLDEVLNRPPLPRAAAEDEVDASQASALHLQAAPRALVHDGAILGARGGDRQTDGDGKTDTETGTERQTERRRRKDRHKDGNRERRRQRDGDGKRHRDGNRQRRRQRDGNGKTDTETGTERRTERETGTKKQRETEARMETQTER